LSLEEPPEGHKHEYPHAHDDLNHFHDHGNNDSYPASTHRHTWWGGHVQEDHSHNEGHVHRHSDHAHVRSPSDILATPGPEVTPGVSLKSLLALGITGGIVPCPGALVVLLSALALHRVAFGLFLIVAFSAGLAAVLIGFGMAMVYAQRFMTRFSAEGPMIKRWLPLASSAVITVVGLALTLSALSAAGMFRGRL
jgi:ABC-type nickel/cobalt efflux system permease component RcnA